MWSNAGWQADQPGFYKNKAAGGVAPSWTPTDAAVDNAAGFITTKTFTARAIGTATATRQVLVVASVKNEGSAGTTLSATIGGVSATVVAHAESASGGVDVALFQANVTSGTTGDIVVTCSAAFGINEIAIGVGVLDGVNATASSVATAGVYAGSQNSPYDAGSSITVPASGFGIGAAGVSATHGTPGWTNITADATSTIAGTNAAVTMGHISTPGAITPSAVFGNFAQEVTLAAAWGP